MSALGNLVTGYGSGSDEDEDSVNFPGQTPADDDQVQEVFSPRRALTVHASAVAEEPDDGPDEIQEEVGGFETRDYAGLDGQTNAAGGLRQQPGSGLTLPSPSPMRHADSAAAAAEALRLAQLTQSPWPRDARGIPVDPIDEKYHHLVPPEPEGDPDPKIQAEIVRWMAEGRRTNLNFTDHIKAKKEYGNPALLQTICDFCKVNDKATNYPPELFDPLNYEVADFYDNLASASRRAHPPAPSESARPAAASTANLKASPPAQVAAPGVLAVGISGAVAGAEEIGAAKLRRASKWGGAATVTMPAGLAGLNLAGRGVGMVPGGRGIIPPGAGGRGPMVRTIDTKAALDGAKAKAEAIAQAMAQKMAGPRPSALFAAPLMSGLTTEQPAKKPKLT